MSPSASKLLHMCGHSCCVFGLLGLVMDKRDLFGRQFVDWGRGNDGSRRFKHPLRLPADKNHAIWEGVLDRSVLPA